MFGTAVCKKEGNRLQTYKIKAVNDLWVERDQALLTTHFEIDDTRNFNSYNFSCFTKNSPGNCLKTYKNDKDKNGLDMGSITYQKDKILANLHQKLLKI